jgi:pyrimidine operon attenuation protein/uracil phosphoribosyltransferase
MQKKLILDTDLLDITISRLCQQLIENHDDFSQTVILGMQPRGIFLAEIIHKKLQKDTKKTIPLGYLDTTFHRDDFRRRQIPVRANETRIDFIIEGKKVVLVDDVLFTGRTIRAAMDAMIAFGRPATNHGTHRPKITANCCGRRLCWQSGQYAANSTCWWNWKLKVINK